VAFLLLVLLLCSAVAVTYSVNLVTAQTGSTITIASDGSVEGTDKILRNGNVYTFTGDIFGTIIVRKGGIIIDGAGYAIKGNGDRATDGSGYGIKLKDKAYETSSYGNVVVKNVRFCDCSILASCSDDNSFINNIFERGTIVTILGGGGNGNVIKRNAFISIDCGVFVDYSSCDDVIIENDFINSSIFVGLYQVPVVDRNYWSDYKTAYPSAKEIGTSGVWDTPYFYDRFNTVYTDLLFDYNPLVNTMSGFDFSMVETGSKPTSTTSNTPAPTAESETAIIENDSESTSTVPTVENSPHYTSETLIVVVVAIMTLVTISIVLLVYFKKHKYPHS
jgi:hypothetical protein